LSCVLSGSSCSVANLHNKALRGFLGDDIISGDGVGCEFIQFYFIGSD
jgi:hypothetical protein